MLLADRLKLRKDPNVPSVELLLHFNGTNGSSVFIDETGKTVIVNGNPTISTAQSKFGGSSAYFDGVGDWLQIFSPNFNFGTKDFTIELWAKANNPQTSGYPTLFSSGVSDELMILSDPNTGGGLVMAYPTVFGRALNSNLNVVTDGLWHHCCFMRKAGSGYLFADGVMVASESTYSTHVLDFSELQIGAQDFQPAATSFKGWMDEFRIVKNKAMYDPAGFTPPTAPFSI